MKKATFFFLIIATLATTFYSCKTNTDDLWDSIHQLDERVTSLEELCKQMNGNISSLQKLVQALQDNNSITKVTPIKEGEKVIGYTISFTKGEPITIYHGEKGEQGDKGDDGTTPIITVDQDGETYYWKVNGEWLTDKKGNKIPTTGEDGQDAISPQLEIRNGRWFLFNGETWTDIGQATGDAGKDGDSFFESVEEKEGYVEFTLPSGTVLTIPKNTLSIVKGIKSVSYIPRYNDGKASVLGTSKADSYIELDFEISPKESADLLVKYDGVVSVQGVYTTIRSRAIDFIQFPVLSISAEDGILSLKVSGENLDDVFFAGTQGVQLALKLEDSESTYASDYIGIVPSLPTYTFTATYKTTSSNQTIKIANDIDAYPIAGAGNRLISIDYGDGISGISSTHTYATQGEYTVTFSFVNEVTEIGGHAFEECSQLTGIEYPKNVTKINDKAFYGTGLINIIIPNTLTYIGLSAFSSCANSEYISIPNSVQFMGSQAFGWSTKGELYVDCNIPSVSNNYDYYNSAFYNSNISKVVIGKNVKSLGACSFGDCKQVRIIEYEEGNRLENIGYGAFMCPLVEEMPIPESVEFIGEYAFSLCSNLKTFKMVGSGNGNYIVRGNGVLYDEINYALVRYPPKNEAETYEIVMFRDSIAPLAFRDCNNLKTVQLPTRYLNNKMRFGRGSFMDCKNLTTVENFSLTGVTMLSGGDDAIFRGCVSLSSIQLPEILETIGDDAFSGYPLKGELIIPSSVVNIGARAFEGCTNLTGNLLIPDNVVNIGEGAFKGCTGFDGNLQFGKNLETINTNAFRGCVNFKGNIVIPDAVKTIGDAAFKGCANLLTNNGELVLGKNLKFIGYGAFSTSSEENDNSRVFFNKIYCTPIVPPIIDNSSLGCRELIVPRGYLDIYKKSDWAIYVSGYLTESY